MSTLLETLLAGAATIGADSRATLLSAEESLNKAKQKAATSREVADREDRALSGFDAPRFVGLAKVASLWGQHFNNRDSQDARDACGAMAKAFVGSFTAQTDKSAAGGKFAGYSHTVALGGNAERLRFAVSQRLSHWQGLLESASQIEDAAERAEAIATAKRYVVVCGPALTEAGEHPTDDKGKVKPAKFRGRPAVVVQGVSIPYAGATNRDSQMAGLSRLMAEYGDRVLVPEVLDAFLDNGGRVKADDSDKTLAGHCADVRAALDAIMSMGGSGSGDAAFLMAAHAVIGRIMEEGFKGAVVAQTSEPEVPEVQSAPEVPEVQSAPEGDPMEGIEGGVVLGGPAAPEATEAPAKATRPRRPRKGDNGEGAAAG